MKDKFSKKLDISQMNCYNDVVEFDIELIKLNRGGKGVKIPKHEIESLARCLLPEIHKFFESEEGKAEFENWKEAQKKKKEK